MDWSNFRHQRPGYSHSPGARPTFSPRVSYTPRSNVWHGSSPRVPYNSQYKFQPRSSSARFVSTAPRPSRGNVSNISRGKHPSVSSHESSTGTASSKVSKPSNVAAKVDQNATKSTTTTHGDTASASTDTTSAHADTASAHADTASAHMDKANAEEKIKGGIGDTQTQNEEKENSAQEAGNKDDNDEDSEEEEEDTGFCKYCNLSFTSVNTYWQHTRGILHTQNLMNSQRKADQGQDNDQSQASGDGQVDSTFSGYHGNNTGNGAKQDNTKDTGNHGDNKFPDDMWVITSSKSDDDNDENEAEETKKPKIPLCERDYNPEDVGKKQFPSKLICKICDVKCNNQDSFDRHMTGVKHRQKLKSMMKSDNFCIEDENKTSGGEKYMDSQRIPVLSRKLRQHDKAFIGMQFITEFQQWDGKGLLVYVCNLCESKCDDSTIIPHCSGFKHRLNYCQEYYPDYYQQLNSRDSNTKKSDQTALADRFAENVVRKEGIGKIKVKVKISEEKESGDSAPGVPAFKKPRLMESDFSSDQRFSGYRGWSGSSSLGELSYDLSKLPSRSDLYGRTGIDRPSMYGRSKDYDNSQYGTGATSSYYGNSRLGSDRDDHLGKSRLGADRLDYYADNRARTNGYDSNASSADRMGRYDNSRRDVQRTNYYDDNRPVTDRTDHYENTISGTNTIDYGHNSSRSMDAVDNSGGTRSNMDKVDRYDYTNSRRGNMERFEGKKYEGYGTDNQDNYSYTQHGTDNTDSYDNSQLEMDTSDVNVSGHYGDRKVGMDTGGHSSGQQSKPRNRKEGNRGKGSSDEDSHELFQQFLAWKKQQDQDVKQVNLKEDGSNQQKEQQQSTDQTAKESTKDAGNLSSGETLMALAQTMIRNEEEAAMALQVSSALTQALLQYRLRTVASEVTSDAIARNLDNQQQQSMLKTMEQTSSGFQMSANTNPATVSAVQVTTLPSQNVDALGSSLLTGTTSQKKTDVDTKLRQGTQEMPSSVAGQTSSATSIAQYSALSQSKGLNISVAPVAMTTTGQVSEITHSDHQAYANYNATWQQQQQVYNKEAMVTTSYDSLSNYQWNLLTSQHLQPVPSGVPPPPPPPPLSNWKPQHKSSRYQKQ